MRAARKVLIIGGGGREHAIAWALARSPRSPEIWCAPGNPGIAQVATCVPIAITDVDALAAFVEQEGIDLTIVGPEAALLAGVADEFRRRGLQIVGPTRDGAMLEGSKTYAKRVMQRAGVPTAAHRSFSSLSDARAHVRDAALPLVIKADGLAAGKGVVIAYKLAEAEAAVESMLRDGAFGEAGSRVVIEEFMHGSEATVMALVSDGVVRALAPSRDHKRAHDGDEGPNTGGMGAYSPVAEISAADLEVIERTILQPVVDLLAADGIDYRGVLYAGLMLGPDGPRVVEFNARFGDPETQAVLPRLTSDLLTVLEAVARGTLGEIDLEWSNQAATCIVVAADNYPEQPRTGMAITLPAAVPESMIFHAGTARATNGDLLVAGGRVLGVTALGPDVPHATRTAYETTNAITFDGAWWRTDIAGSATAKLVTIN